MLETVLISIFLGFIGSRLGVMAYDFMCYKEIFGWIKVGVAKLIFDKSEIVKFEKDLYGKNLPKSQEQEEFIEYYDYLAAESMIIGLLDCKYCLTIWASLIVSIFSTICYEVGIESIILTPIFGYLITEKL